MMYKLTKGSVSIIRQDEAGVKEAETNGYKLDGECNEAYEVTNSSPSFSTEAATEEVKAETSKRGKTSKAAEGKDA
jgi:hypothetical protein